MIVTACASCGGSTGQSSAAPSGRPARAVGTKIPERLRAALAGMQRAPDFSFDASVLASNSTTRLIGQFEAPDREHLVLTPSSGSSNELLFIGTKTYVRSVSGKWQDALGGVAGSNNPLAAFAALQGSRCRPAPAQNGSPGSRYACTLSAGNASTIVRGSAANGPVLCSVTVNGATISDLSLRGKGFDVMIAYTNVGTTPPLPQPD